MRIVSAERDTARGNLVDGIATERIFELVVAGETLDAVAARYEMPVEDVRAACAFEETVHSYAA